MDEFVAHICRFFFMFNVILIEDTHRTIMSSYFMHFRHRYLMNELHVYVNCSSDNL